MEKLSNRPVKSQVNEDGGGGDVTRKSFYLSSLVLDWVLGNISADRLGVERELDTVPLVLVQLAVLEGGFSLRLGK